MALLACARIGAAHSVVFGGFSSDSLRDRIQDAEAKVLDHRRRRLAPRADRPAQGDRRPRGRGVPDHREGARAATHRARHRDDRRPRRVVARPRARAVGRLPARADGRRRPPLPALHQRHHGAAQGHHAHDRWLPHPGRVDAPERVRSPRRHRRLLVRGRRRLGDRPLVHRLRTADERRHQRDLRGHARPPRQGPALADRRAVRRHHPLHRAHRDPHLHEVGTRVRRAPRPVARCDCSAASASPSTPKRGSGTGSTSVGSAARSSTPGGRPRPAPS